ncbi:asparagine synthase (glutamine-hydrolyzing) [Candidatus Uabimicrobium sp. HlEnr_7]|uniref:asparagine synthase (glutamine-hydrolyzing) n=1 Tax=Candidatus Uabimicrobium helgolandensis TaxID=3095367 RepID=UPI003558A80D
MCGIFGSTNIRAENKWIKEASKLLSHRGPDEQNTWHDSENGVVMGHARLSVIDLSVGGRQPMHSKCKRYTIVYNGEIYNYLQIKKTLQKKGVLFESNSDTEVILAAIEIWGLNKTLNTVSGMYAFALWDKNQKTLHLVRDRVGIKPLYYANFGDFWVFSSELKPIIAHPGCEQEIDRNALALYMKYKYVPSPNCIFHNVYKLPPATILSISASSTKSQTYWNINSTLSQQIFFEDQREAQEQLEKTLGNSVREHMLSDVPLGAFLSGGVDSATIVALMSENHSRIKTFNIGFTESSHDESSTAQSVAQHLGTDHTQVILTAKEAQQKIPLLPLAFDEPFADSSQIPMLLVSEIARKKVTVALSGDGGDELFAGYNRYIFAPKVIKLSRVPGSKLISRLLLKIPNYLWDMPFTYNKKWQLADRIKKVAHILSKNSPSDVYEYLVSCWQEDSIVKQAEPLPFSGGITKENFIEDMMLSDFSSYLVDDILTKVDRASMFYSLEARVPYLDHRVVECAMRIPLHMKINNGVGKNILRKILYKRVPQNLFCSPKMGFALPLHKWLRTSLQDWAEDVLSSPQLNDFFDMQKILHMWKQHKSGNKNYQEQLWSVLMFQLWLEKYKG